MVDDSLSDVLLSSSPCPIVQAAVGRSIVRFVSMCSSDGSQMMIYLVPCGNTRFPSLPFNVTEWAGFPLIWALIGHSYSSLQIEKKYADLLFYPWRWGIECHRISIHSVARLNFLHFYFEVGRYCW